MELAPLRATTVTHGPNKTALWSLMLDEDRKVLFSNAAERLPARRIGQPEDIANAVLFLATTPFATGSAVRVDGGGVNG